jgi:hypothetical protein
MADKTQLRICDLSNEHLLNIIEMLKARGHGRGATALIDGGVYYEDYSHRAVMEYLTSSNLWDAFLINMWNSSMRDRALVCECIHRGLLDKIRIRKKKLFGAWVVWKRTKGNPAGQYHLGSFKAYEKADLERVLKNHRFVVAMNRPNVEIVVKELTENQQVVARVLDEEQLAPLFNLDT